ncbi:MAG TPA: sigma-70 family RNA polymerase sigma factor [Chitinophagaceae bacterium]|nr:sigma-70 family RNA polymerase sigma factor [Chitinophagaceae bacterium]
MENEQQIIEGCLQQNRRSQEKLYKQFYPGLFALCRSFFEDDHDALTALNNGMLMVFRKIDRYDASKGSLFNWAYTVVRNAALSYIKNKQWLQSYDCIDEQLADVRPAPALELLEPTLLRSYVDALPVKTRLACVLFYLEGFSIKDIVKHTGMKEGTVKWHLNESRTRLKELLTGQHAQRIA